jgi:predicted alpha/beta superfamily hydrolase
MRIGLLAAVLGTLGAPVPAATPCQPAITGVLELHQLDSRVFGNSRMLRVLLPAGYGEPVNAGRRYPVLYLLDGQNLFDACLSPYSHREWGVDETVARLVAGQRIPPLIVVGIDHAGAARAREFLPYPDDQQDPAMAQPDGRRFPEFLADEVLPYVDAHYRTLRGARNTGIGGSSYGGNAALYAILQRPELFGYGLIESAPLSVGGGRLLRDARAAGASAGRVSIGVGGQEGSDPQSAMQMVALARELGGCLVAAGRDPGSVQVQISPHARHTEAAWAARLPSALQFLFGDWRDADGMPAKH